VDPDTNLVTVPMTYHGAGLYSATIPGQTAGAQVAFFLEALDAGAPSVASRFPNDAPARECLVRFGEPAGLPDLGTYRLWVSQRNVTRWNTREKQSNHPLDMTFVYGDTRVCYNAGTLYSGSPWHTPGYTGPMSGLCDYELNLAKDDTVLGASDFVLATVGNYGSDPSLQGEQAAFWIMRKLGAPYMHRRHISVFFDGLQRGNVYEDAQQPDRNVVSQFFPDDDAGSLHKIEDWFEFDDTGDNKTGNVEATLENFTTTGGLKKAARYRWNWRPRGLRESANDFTNLFTLVDAVNSAQPRPYRSLVANLINVDEWMRIIAAEHVVGNWDSFGYNRGKNMYAYKPERGPWMLLPWDIDFVFNAGADQANTALFTGTEPAINAMRAFPEFQRAYWRAFEDAVNGPLNPVRFNARIDAIYNGLAAAGAAPDAAATQGVKDYAAARRDYILTQLDTVATNFAVNGPASFSTNRNLVTLTGTAPIGVATITVNDVATQPTWTSVTEWTLNITLQPGVNSLTVIGWDGKGQFVSGAAVAMSINYTGTNEPAQGNVVFNEIMYNPAVPDTEFVEIRSMATNTAYDLSSWRINGLDCTIPAGTILQPGAFLLFGKNSEAFWQTYGNSVPVAGVFNGSFDNGGETIQLIRPGATPAQDTVIDEVTYADDMPWPGLADGFGPSLQLVDATQDNNRVANWSAVAGGGSIQTNTLISITDSWKYDQSGTDLGTIWRDAGYDDSAWSSGAALLYVEKSALPAPKNTALTIGPTTYYFRKAFNFTGNPATTTLSARFVIDDGAVVYLNGTNVLSPGMSGGTISYTNFANRSVDNAVYEGPFTLSAGSLVQGTNVIAVEVHQASANSSDVVFGMTLEAVSTPPAACTPGAANSVATTLPAIPRLWLNELQAQNTSGPQDRFGERDPWIELHNSGTSAIGLTNLFLTDSYTNLTRWAFPAGYTVNAGEFKLVWMDGQPAQTGAGELHAGFAINSPTGSVALVQVVNNRTSIVDYLNYNLPVANRSYGAFPDGTPAHRTGFYISTPGAANTNGYPEVTVSINEWMAGNSSTVTDPLDGKFSDWFELHNYGTEPVDLSGFTLTDDLTDPDKWTIPGGFTIGPGKFLLVWADEDPGQNGQGSDLHADFSLRLSGEAIGLFTPNRVAVATVTFGQQTNNISEGRWPDDGPNRYFMSTPTPGAANYVPGEQNHPPVLASIGNRTVNEHALLTFTATATDSDTQQTLTFSLDPGAPAGAAINPGSGVFTWTPSEAQGPGVHAITIRVTDNGTTNLSDTETISVTVNEVNAAPTLYSIGNRTVTELSTLTFTASAADADQPANTLTFSLDEGAPAGTAINPNTGVFTWTPTEQQGPGNYSVTIVVSDNGTPSLNAAETISVTVNEANQTPQLAPVSNVSLLAGRTLNITNSASDSDLPTQTLTFQLLNPPQGMTINPSSGWLTWRPLIAQAGTTNAVKVRVSDNGTPSMAATQTFSATVLKPVSPVITSRSVTNGWFNFHVAGDQGPDYVIEGGTAASGSWIPLITNVAPTLPFDSSVPVFTNNSKGFYRVRLAP
ncbi:MAG TPA: lamin tail domain-containing protein, partial [Candidatus Paceibacterota bacterium]|nr:lamin tail domain-containing protein [Candidatus Paceibacterota bacterium]